MSKTLTWAAAETARPTSATLLYLAAAGLHAASGVLERLAAQLSRARTATAPTVVEFHSLHREAGAPEGALYIDGEFVGVIEGVTRL